VESTDCGSTYIYLRKRSDNGFLFAAVPARCKSWDCPVCRKIKSGIVSKYVEKHFSSCDLYMLTLTFYHSGSVLDCWRQIGARWNRLRSYLQKSGRSISYLRIVEPHKNGGWPHLHVLIRGFSIDSTVLKKITDWGFGWNCQCQRMSAAAAARYVSKYLSKPWPSDLSQELRKKTKTRIVCVSQDLPAIFTKESEWECVSFGIPSSHTEFMCNAAVSVLKSKNCQFVRCAPFFSGFVIESDISLSISDLLSFSDPYVWRYCRDFEYEFFRHGFQCSLFSQLSGKPPGSV
jgi:hypothetical protein